MTTPLWLSHHRPDDYDRCAAVAGRHVCRRCLLLYPLALATMVACLVVWPEGVSPWVLAIGPLPAVVDWWREHLGQSAYDPRRQLIVTVPLAIALGAGLARYVEDPLDGPFWAMVLVYGGACLGVALWRWLDEHAP